MGRLDTSWHWLNEERSFGDIVFHAALPNAIRSLDDHELQTLLVALLLEWRGRVRDLGNGGGGGQD